MTETTALFPIDVGPNVAVQDIAEQVERRINERGGEAAADEIVALTIEVLWEKRRATPPALHAAPVADGWRPMGRAPRPVLLGVVAAQRGVLDAEGITDEKARTILLATFNRMWEDSERDQPDEWFLFDIDFQEILDGAAAGARRVRTWIVPADSRGSWWLTAKGRDLFDTILYASLKAWHAEPGQRTRHG